MTETRNLTFVRVGAGDPKRYTVLTDGVEIGRVNEYSRGRFGKYWKAFNLEGALVGSGATRQVAASELLTLPAAGQDDGAAQ